MSHRLSEEDAARLARVFREYFGWEFGPEVRTVFEARLSRRLTRLGLDGFPEYVERLNSGPGREEELRQVADILTTRETYFFREGYQLKALSEEIFPRLGRDRPLRIWSAGCASGEEPYTLAMLALERLPRRRVEVLGTDISPSALAAARRGVYDASALRETPSAARDRWFVPAGIAYTISDEVRSCVRFATLNLATDPAPDGPFDVIVCRNVIIYFSNEVKKRLATRFLHALVPGGWMLLGHAESLVSVTREFELVTLKNDVVYRRPAEERRIKVLVADDSAFARRTMSRIVEGLDGVDMIGSAPDGIVALREIKRHEPDVVLLDLEMPELDGFGVLRAIRQLPVPPQVIVVSAQAQAANVVKALELGAFDFVAKPGHEASPMLERVGDELRPRLEALRGGARARPMPFHLTEFTPPHALARIQAPGEPVAASGSADRPAGRVVVIGASTGGPGALLEIVESLPADFPAAIAIALHMPSGFTHAFAERLGRRGRLPAREARDGDILARGRILVCPGGYHMKIARTGGELRCVLEAAEGESWVPSVDRLFASAADLDVPLLGVVLTGMGTDGVEGSMRFREAGGRILVESAETAVVNGMPGAVVEAGAAHAIHRREDLAGAIAAWART